jgi:hypothetical protein
MKNTITKQKLIEYYIIQKLSLRHIAVLFNKTHVCILSKLKKYNIPRRTKYEMQIGKHVSDETREKLRISHLGQKSWNKGKKFPEFSGKNNPMFGKHRFGSEAPAWKGGIATTCKCGKPKSHHAKGCKECRTLNNTQIIKCSFCGKEKRIQNCLKKSHNFCSRVCKDKWASENQIGVKASGYIHGKANLPYPNNWNKKLRTKIRNRDNRVCQMCGIHQDNLNRSLSIHHIDYNKENCAEDNLISLCVHCHGFTNKNREYWKQYFSKKVG